MQRSCVAPNDSDAVHGQTTSHEHVSKYDPEILHPISPLPADQNADAPPIVLPRQPPVKRASRASKAGPSGWAMSRLSINFEALRIPRRERPD